MNEFPSFIYAWSQSDRYALALGFVRNHLNLFKPETFLLGDETSLKCMVPIESSITGVDFPIHEYVVALLMKITGIHSPWIFRLYTLLFSFVGLYFLYRTAILVSENQLRSIFVVLFASTSPVFVYYQSGFLPTIPSLANVSIGVFFIPVIFMVKKTVIFICLFCF